MKVDGKEFLEVKDQIIKSFKKSEWLELGYSVNCQDIIQKHVRLLRSLEFGDDDYEGNVLEVMDQIIKRNPSNLEKIKKYIAHKFSIPIVSDFVSTGHRETPRRVIQFAPQIFDVPDKQINEKLVVVMMPFRRELDETFNRIKASCNSIGLECQKVSDIWENSTIIQDIFELIFISNIVIGDFTGKNPNVFYEIGIAHTLGKSVIPITQSMDDVPFDLKHHRVLHYLPNNEGYDKLEAELKKRLKTLSPPEESF